MTSEDPRKAELDLLRAKVAEQAAQLERKDEQLERWQAYGRGCLNFEENDWPKTTERINAACKELLRLRDEAMKR